MLGCERRNDDSCILEFDRWSVHELQIDPPKLIWLWERWRKYKALFSDLTSGDFENFLSLIKLPDSLWLEIKEGDTIVGVMYWTDLRLATDVQIHLTFFDRKPIEKVELCKLLVRWFFTTFPAVRRMSAYVPAHYTTTLRMARKAGFQEEGRRRQVYLMNGTYFDEIVLGLLASEVDNGWFN